MKKYIGTKEVEAMPMTLGELINKSGRNPYENDGKMHGNNEKGYLVKYKDGYESWSPAEPFEEAYKCADTFLDRLHIEMRDLYEKMDKLSPFIESGKIDEIVTDKYQNYLLRLQHRIMSRYINVLECRIGRLDGSPEAPLHLVMLLKFSNKVVLSVELDGTVKGYLLLSKFRLISPKTLFLKCSHFPSQPKTSLCPVRIK